MDQLRRRSQWAIRVMRPDGTEYYVRRFDPQVPEFPVMMFRSKHDAECGKTYLRHDLEGCVATVVRV